MAFKKSVEITNLFEKMVIEYLVNKLPNADVDKISAKVKECRDLAMQIILEEDNESNC